MIHRAQEFSTGIQSLGQRVFSAFPSTLVSTVRDSSFRRERLRECEREWWCAGDRAGIRDLSCLFVTRHRGESVRGKKSRAATHSSSNNNILLKFLFLGRYTCARTCLYVKGPSIWLRAPTRAGRAYGYEDDDVSNYYCTPAECNVRRGSNNVTAG